MTCADARALFSALVDDEATAAERAAADTHLAGCTECRHELDRFARTVSMVRALPAERAPAGFVDRVVDAAHPVPWPRRLARRLFVPLRVHLPMQVAALLVIATTTVWVFQRTPELQQAAHQEAPALRAPAPVPAPPPPSAGSSSSRARAAAPPVTSSNEGARQTPPTRVDESQSRAKEEKVTGAHPIAPREMETRAEGDVGGLGAGSKAAEAPASAPARDAMAKQSAPSVTARAAAADVTATWRVEDRATALRELEELVTRVGGGPVTRHTEGAVEIVEFSVPREAYDDVTSVLEWFGRLTVVPATGPLPPTVRVSLRVTG